jgi:hypothetical protein
VAFRQLPALARSQEAYDRFSAATDLPLTLLAVQWLPVLVLPLVMSLPASVVRTFDLIDLVIWLLYAAEYLVRLYLSRSRSHFVTHHLVDLAVVVLPVLRRRSLAEGLVVRPGRAQLTGEQSACWLARSREQSCTSLIRRRRHRRGRDRDHPPVQ